MFHGMFLNFYRSRINVGRFNEADLTRPSDAEIQTIFIRNDEGEEDEIDDGIGNEYPDYEIPIENVHFPAESTIHCRDGEFGYK